MGRNAVETVLGAAVLAVAAIFASFTYSTADIKAVKGYKISASFYKIGGLGRGSDVRISGIKVGTVEDLHLDPETFDAVVSMTILPHVKIPVDTVASISSEGILGGKYVRLEPGADKTYMVAGASMKKTKDFRSLEDQVGEIIFLATGGDKGGR
ncbi:MAG: MCE family protein [Alphaproteobacteria bacterium]|jgi:phospholipid/cholesterol/gamma-HCH transport system substrate-binding protein|nr:MCE family protein [Alphaproteobacteria bacterium]MBT7943842.1 MCE family protein [Alphaproteobacteria bacterium]